MSTAAEELRDRLAEPEPKRPSPVRGITLYAVTEDFAALVERIVENGGEVTPEDERALEALEGTFLEKSERVAFKVRELLASADAAKNEADRLARHAAAFKNAAERLKSYLMASMERTGQTKIRTPRSHIWIQTNGVPSIRWEGRSYEDIPARYRKTKSFLDTEAVRSAMADGEELPEGIIVERGTHLRIG